MSFKTRPSHKPYHAPELEHELELSLQSSPSHFTGAELQTAAPTARVSPWIVTNTV
jgi:hypothetical protein